MDFVKRLGVRGSIWRYGREAINDDRENNPFYDRSEEERIAITMASISERRTVLERWAVLADTEANPWSARAAMAAELLADEAGVTDLGCGTMNLERYLHTGQSYIPIDVVARDARTIVCDFNREMPPQTSASAAACLGLIEYLHKPDDFMRVLRGQYKTAVVSYCVADAPEAPQKRREHAWVNDFDTAGVEALFLATGWNSTECRWIDKIQRLWRLNSANA
jgi:hypothetical protein